MLKILSKAKLIKDDVIAVIEAQRNSALTPAPPIRKIQEFFRFHLAGLDLI